MKVRKTISKFGSVLGIASVLHFTVADLVYAETSAELQDAASQANIDLFKQDPATLYSNSSGTIEILGASPTGNATLSASDLYYGVEGQSATDGALPSVDDYDDLYGYRDAEIEQLEAGTGKFSSTGSLNAEATAVEILNGSANTPSVSTDAFLQTSRDIISDREAIEDEFGSCIVTENTGENSYTYEDYTTETCDKYAVDTTSASAIREYKGPEHIFSYVEEDGVAYCEWEDVKVKTDAIETCSRLSILSGIPTANTDEAELSVQSCEGNRECVEIVLRQNNSSDAVAVNFTVSDSIELTKASVTATGLEEGAWASYQGSTVMTENGSMELPSVLTSKGSVQTVGVYSDAGARDPETGSYRTSSRYYKTDTWLSFSTSTVYWDELVITNSLDGAVVGSEAAYYDGWYYYKDKSNYIDGKYGVYRTKNTTREPVVGLAYSVSYWNIPESTPFKYAVLRSEPSSANWVHHKFYWNGSLVGETAWSTIMYVGGCTYYRGDEAEGNYGQDEIYGIYRICNVEAPSEAAVTVRLEFDETLFTDWTYNATRWAEILAAEADGLISISYEVNESAANENGCVYAYAGSDGKLGELCGSGIPVDPFDGLNDRAATQITIKPTYAVAVTEDEEEAYTEANTCQAYEKNPACFFVEKICADDDEDYVNTGTCKAYQYTYKCGSTVTYSTPSVTEVNICESDLSCLGTECIPDTSTDGSVDLADAASKLAAADMIMSDMNCSEDLTTAVNADEAILSCELFGGDKMECKKVTLGLANCCSTASGVSIADYLKLAMSISRLSNVIEGTSLDNPVTSAWVSMEDLTGNTMSKLTRPLTEVWDSIVGNSEIAKTAANTFSMEAVKQTMMKNMAQWTADVFGEQAANALFQMSEGGAAVVDGAVQSGTIGLSTTAATVMSAVMTAYAIYTLINVLASILFACSDEEKELMVKKALKSTHYIGEYCSSRVLGVCVKRKKSYCTFSSPLSRIFNEQARLQLGISWGSAKSPNCQGITVAQFQSLDMDAIDLSEWTGMMVSSGLIDTASVEDIDDLTGDSSTMGESLEGLYDRENAVERNVNKVGEWDTDAIRQDAIEDFGGGLVDN